MTQRRALMLAAVAAGLVGSVYGGIVWLIVKALDALDAAS